MDDCKSCKSKEQYAEPVPYIVHEGTMARAEITIKRLWITILLLIALLVGTNGAWIWYCNQWETVESWEIMQENDGANNNFIGNEGYITNNP